MKQKPMKQTAFRAPEAELRTLAKLARKLRTTKTDVIRRGIQLQASSHGLT